MAHLRMVHDLRALIAAAPLPVGMRLVPFTPAIAPACRALLNDAYAGGMGDVLGFQGWWTALVVDAEYSAELCFVVTDANGVVGFCQCWSSSFIKDIAVAERARRQGIGAALVTLALTALKSRGATSCALKTDVENLQAQRLYRRLGFVAVERIEAP